MHITISNFAAIFNKLQEFFWAATLQIIYETFGTKFTKTNTRFGFLSKNHPISKKKMGRIGVRMWEI